MPALVLGHVVVVLRISTVYLHSEVTQYPGLALLLIAFSNAVLRSSAAFDSF